jgi:acetylglutamate kinase
MPVDAAQRSRVLIESLPYLREFHNQIVVIKYGGHAMIDDALKRSFALNVALLKLVGIHPVIVHGGGPQISDMLGKLGIHSHFLSGQRVTDEATMTVVEMVLVGSVNKDIVNQINQAGALAVGLSGKDGLLIEAEKLEIKVTLDNQPTEIIDLGNVGDVTKINTNLIHSLMSENFVPVIAPVGVNRQGATFNINADNVAGACAAALKAKRLLLLTDVSGVLDGQKQLIPSISRQEAARLIADGIIDGGMIPKAQCCMKALEGGAQKASIVDGRVENCVLLELFTDRGVGTEMRP